MKAKLKGSAKYTDCFEQCKVVLPISVGQEAHEGAKFLATLQLVSKRFRQCDIVIADTLQRFNLINKNTSLEDAAKASKVSGDLWLERNQNYFKALAIPYHIVRWDECLNWPTFSNGLDITKCEYAKNSQYQQAFTADIAQFLSRKNTEATPTLHDTSLAYFFEEIAVILSYFIDQQYQYIIYPSNIPKSAQLSRDLFLSTPHPGLVRELGLYFR